MMDHGLGSRGRMANRGVLFAVGLVASMATATAVAAPAAPKKPMVEVFGDRFGTVLASGLIEIDPTVAIAMATNDFGGLSSPGYADWLRNLHDRLARQPKPDVAVMMVGEHDHGTFVDGAARLDPGTPAWVTAYGARVDAVAKLFRDARVPLIWVGLPAVRNPDVSADYSRIDGLLRDHAASAGVRFIDIWSGFTDEAGRYSPDGPDTDGNPARLRRGIGFTPVGARKLASFVVPDVARLAKGTVAPGTDPAGLTIERARDFDAALSIDVNAQIRREAARNAPAPRTTAPAGPAAGPILPLTGESAPTGADLAALPATGGAPAAALAPAIATAEPKPGRADDFSWPKP